MALFKKWRDVAGEDEFAESDRKQVYGPAGEDVLLLKIEGAFHAVSNVCSHAWALMLGGDVDGHALECPLHGARFDVRDGRALTPPAVKPIAVYEVKVEQGRILVRM